MNQPPPDLTEDEVEGLGTGGADGSWGDYPIDTVLIRTETRTVHDVLRRIEQGQFVMDPDFQRDFVWPDDKQSKLIESVLMRIPLPVFYLAEDTAGRMIVVDGLQRLSTFQRFVQNELRLRLPEQIELHGKRFQELSPKLQNRIEDCNLVLYVIDAKVPERARLDIFDRVNSGVPLTRQQMRNCLYTGEATRFLKTEAMTELFKEATGHSLASSTMRDREFVNRFCAFRLLPLADYRDMDEFLASALERMNGLQPRQMRELSEDFRRGLANNLEVFGPHAFRKQRPGRESRSVINASLWDVMSVGLCDYPEDVVRQRAAQLQEAFLLAMNDDKFTFAITYGTNDPKQVNSRFSFARDMLTEVFGAYPA